MFLVEKNFRRQPDAFFHLLPCLQGDCEHRVVFCSIRRFNMLVDYPFREAYPIRTFKALPASSNVSSLWETIGNVWNCKQCLLLYPPKSDIPLSSV